MVCVSVIETIFWFGIWFNALSCFRDGHGFAEVFVDERRSEYHVRWCGPSSCIGSHGWPCLSHAGVLSGCTEANHPA